MTEYVSTDTLKRKPRWTPEQAVAYARGEVTAPDKNYFRLCDHFTSWCYGYAGSGYASAIVHWRAIEPAQKHTTGIPPAGALVFWEIGKWGHVAVSLGDGTVASNDIHVKGQISIAHIGEFATKWGAKYLGWTTPVFYNAFGSNPNPAPVIAPPAPPAPVKPKPPVVKPPVKPKPTQPTHVISVFNVQPGRRNQSVLLLQQALAAEVGLDYRSGPGVFGPRTRLAYVKWQRKCGLKGLSLNGKPNFDTLSKLGKKYGFAAGK